MGKILRVDRGAEHESDQVSGKHAGKGVYRVDPKIGEQTKPEDLVSDRDESHQEKNEHQPPVRPEGQCILDGLRDRCGLVQSR